MIFGNEHFLQQKYGHSYSFMDYADIANNSGDIIPWRMFTVPMPYLVDMYKEHYKNAPKTMIDCGAAYGYMIRWAEKMGIKASGIDMRKYPFPTNEYRRYFNNGKIRICNLLDVEPFSQDLAYANGMFTYLAERDLNAAISKFKNVKMLIAIHNTTEDIAAAKEYGTPIDIDCQSRLIRSNNWWIDRFQENGFDAVFNKKYSCFCITPKTR